MRYQEEEDVDYGIIADPEAAYRINRELNLARRIVEETGANLFLTGKAGTGKTTFLRKLREDSKKRMVVLAPTGVAAINAGGMTIHSFFQLPFSPFIPGKGFVGEEKRFFRFSREKRRLIASIDLIVIDEISMVRPDTLDAIDMLLRRFRNPSLPFGGVQLLLIGDLRQLAPVVRGNEWNLLHTHYASPYFFESKSLQEAGFLTVELLTIYRQQDDEFISILNAIRDGMASMDTLSALNRKCLIGGSEIDSDLVIRLTTHNRTSDDINSRKLLLLPGDPTVFKAKVKGKFPESSYPADEFLSLKRGARVMFIKNDSGMERRYYNGMIGTVTQLSADSVTVRPDDGSEDIDIGYVEWENTRYEVDEETKEIRQSVEGSFSQIPLRLAWAITIHKSQGLTFDRAVIDAANSFAPGQLYVALSRCRSLEGLHLETPLSRSAVIIDRDVNTFIDRSRASAPDEDTLSSLRDEYYRSLLREMFNFNSLKYAFADFAKCVAEYVAPIYPELYPAYSDATLRLSRDVADVGDKFMALYTSVRMDADKSENNPDFNEKICNGCKYFLERLVNISDLCNDTPLTLDNAAYEKRLFSAADTLWFELNLKKRILIGIAEEGRFSPSSYMRVKALAVLDMEDEAEGAGKSSGGCKNKQEKKNRVRKEKVKKEKKPKGYSQRESLRLFREGNSIERIAEMRSLTPSTIASHLIEMTNLGEIALSDILPVDIKRKLDGIHAAKPDMSFAEFKEAASDAADPYHFQIYYRLVASLKS